MSQRRPPNDGTPPLQDEGFDLELEEVESDTDLRNQRIAAKAVPREEILDLTFTRPGQRLNASKSAYDRATSTGQSRLAWRRMREGFNGMSRSPRAIAAVAIGIVALLLALWLVRAVWRGAVYAVNSTVEVARGVAGNLQPPVGAIQDSGKQFTEKMRELWSDVQAEGNELEDTPPPPKRVRPEHIDGDEWPSAENEQLEASDFAEPNELIEDLLKHKGIAVTKEGLGVFHVDGPLDPEQPSWIGGFGLLGRRGGSVKGLLHGTVVHNAANGDVLVGRFQRGMMQEFWLVKGPEDKRIVIHLRTQMDGDQAVPDGAAFALDTHRTTSLALVYEAGEPMGGQWCRKARDKDGQFVYQPPDTILGLSELRAASPESEEYLSQLDDAISRLPELEEGANKALRSFIRSAR